MSPTPTPPQKTTLLNFFKKKDVNVISPPAHIVSKCAVLSPDSVDLVKDIIKDDPSASLRHPISNLTNKNKTSAPVNTSMRNGTSFSQSPVIVSQKRSSRIIVSDDDDDDDSDDKTPSNVKKARVVAEVMDVLPTEDSMNDEVPSTQLSSRGRLCKKSKSTVVSDDDDDEDSFINDDDDDDDDDDDNIKNKQRKPSCKPSTNIIRKSTTKSASVVPSMFSPGASKSTAQKPSTTPQHYGSSAASPSTAAAITDIKDLVSVGGALAVKDAIEQRLFFVYDDNKRRDINGNRLLEPNFDSTTVKVPKEFYDTQTDAMKQWWDVKSKNLDKVLFFKVGKFYELFEMDSDIGHRELGLQYMGGTKPHVGFPEKSYIKYSVQLANLGYRVVRVEQTQTPEQMKEQNASAARGQSVKVVRRDVCAIVTKSTLIEDQEMLLHCPHARYLLSITEIPWDISTNAPMDSLTTKTCFFKYGLCFVEASTGHFSLGTFTDDRQRTLLRTAIAQISPSEIIYEREFLSIECLKIIKFVANSHPLYTPDKDKFWSADVTIQHLLQGQYFKSLHNNNENNVNNNGNNKNQLPLYLHQLSQASSTSIDAQLCLSALGGLSRYLKVLMIDQNVISLGNFTEYRPMSVTVNYNNNDSMDDIDMDIMKGSLDTTNPVPQKIKSLSSSKEMVMDGQTLLNLEIIHSETTGEVGGRGTLLSLIDHSVSAFGKRKLRQWIERPLYHIHSINERLDMVTDLMSQLDAMSQFRLKLKTIPDLERLFARIHSNSQQKTTKNEAVMYEHIDKKKLNDFLQILNGFEAVQNILQPLRAVVSTFQSKTLKNMISVQKIMNNTIINEENGSMNDDDEGLFPNITPILSEFKASFDLKQAIIEGFIIPSPGVVSDYDANLLIKKDIENELTSYLNTQKNTLKCKNLQYTHVNNEPWQIEVPDHIGVPKEYELRSQKKGFKRYHTTFIMGKIHELNENDTERQTILKDISRRLYERFCYNKHMWQTVIEILGALDCLCCLALTSAGSTGIMSRPHFINNDVDGNDDKVIPELIIQNGRHPSLLSNDNEYVPNDTRIGGSDHSSVILLTGPNMGGKSTLLRQTTLIVILAQMGCYVPASYCALTPVDRIFTRIGANDRIMQGQSTFYVELEETSIVLHQATKHSLVILDELGRGTSTLDGTAIAYAVIDYIASTIHCRTLFSTHYHILTEAFQSSTVVQPYHMACEVHSKQSMNDDDVSPSTTTPMADDDDDDDAEHVSFLYKLIPGGCPKSYGLNVARLAGIHRSIIIKAKEISEEFESKIHIKSLQNTAMATTMMKSLLDVVGGVATGMKKQQILDDLELLERRITEQC